MDEKSKRAEHIRVCMLVHQDYYIDARVMQYVDILLSHDFDVDVLCSRSEKPAHGISENRLNVYPIAIEHGQGGPAKILIEYLISFLFYFFYLTRLFFLRRYALIHVHNMPDFLVFAALVPKLFGAKLILDIHDPMPEFFLSKFTARYSPFSYLLRIEEYLSILFSDAVITANPIFQENLIRRGILPSKLTVVKNYPDPQIFTREQYRAVKKGRKEQFRLVYPGTIASRYGLDIPIRALVRLTKEIPNIRLTLVGPDSPYKNELDDLAEELGVRKWLELRVAVPLDKVPEVLAESDVGIYTARPDAHMDIAISGKILEYAVMGIPVVSARLRILETLFPGDALLYFPPGDIDAFSTCIIDLFRQPELGRALVSRMDRVMTERHSWVKEQTVYIDLLHSLLS